MGEPTTEFVAEWSGDGRGEVEGEGAAEPIGEPNTEDAREPLRELRKGFPVDKRMTAGTPAGELAVDEG